ncbi:MAG: hypothetical protein ACI88L_000072 [Candidatus Paceibacteria bacterium]|jgi:hypothetical protein
MKKLRSAGFLVIGALSLAAFFVVIAASVKTSIVSVSSTGEYGDSISGYPDMTPDGRYVTYYSDSTNLVAGDNNGTADIFLYDTETGSTIRVSVSSAGAQANGSQYDPEISSDGEHVVYESNSTNLVDNDSNGTPDVFNYNIQSGTTTIVSLSTAGGQGDGASTDPEISSEGRYVVFKSSSTDLVASDTNAVNDIFLRDMQSGTTTRVSVSSAEAQANGASVFPDISGDGRYIIFRSLATNLVASDTNSASDIFLRDTQLGTTVRVSVSTAGVEGNASSGTTAKTSTISENGRYVVFDSIASNLVVNDTNESQDIFLRDLQEGTTERVSVDSNGLQSNGTSTRPFISGDGSYITFSSDATNLVSGDTNANYDIFLYSTLDGTTQRISVDSNGEESDGNSYRASVSDDGKSLFYGSYATNLVLDDSNGSLDVFRYEFVPNLNEGGSSFVYPPQCEFVLPSAIEEGETLYLKWQVTWPGQSTSPFYYKLNGEIYSSNTSGLTILPGESLYPDSTQYFTLAAINRYGATICEENVTLEEPTPDPEDDSDEKEEDPEPTPNPEDDSDEKEEEILPLEPLLCNVTGIPSVITAGQQTNLTWKIQGGTSPYLTYLNGEGFPISQPYTVNPIENTVYSITAVDVNDTRKACFVGLTVYPQTPPTIQEPLIIKPPVTPLTAPTITTDSPISTPNTDVPVEPQVSTEILTETKPPQESITFRTIDLANFLDKPTTTIATTIALAVGLITAVTGAFAGALGASEIVLLPTRLGNILLTALGLRKKQRAWGTVYDSKTKQPLDPVYVTLTNTQTGIEHTAITDMDGRYSFLVDQPGEYTLTANKADYTFPSSKLLNQTSDHLYQNLYTGGIITISQQGQVITNNIPLDATNVNWNEKDKLTNNRLKFYKKRDYLLTKTADTLFYLGFLVALAALLFFPQPYNIATFALYILFAILKKTGYGGRRTGSVTDSKNNPIPFAILRLISPTLNQEMKHTVADKYGRYHMLANNGVYDLKVEERDGDQIVKEMTHSGTQVVNGVLKKKIKM